MPCACRAAVTQQSQDATDQSRSAMSWGYAATGALLAGVAGSHVAHAEAEVPPSHCSASIYCMSGDVILHFVASS